MRTFAEQVVVGERDISSFSEVMIAYCQKNEIDYATLIDGESDIHEYLGVSKEALMAYFGSNDLADFERRIRVELSGGTDA